jgi:type I restriction enzyme S subunit
MGLKSYYKKTEVGVIPEDWEVMSIGQIARIKTGPFGTLLKASEYSSEGVPVVSVGEIRHGYLRISDNTPRVSEVVTKRLPQYVLKAGDIVFGRKGGVDRSAHIRKEEDGWFLGSDGIAIRADVIHQPEFLAFQFQTTAVKNWLLQNSIGTTMPSLNQGVLSRVQIPIPSTIHEQEAIAEALSDADALIESLEQLLAKKRNLKQGAMQKLLSGEIRLAGFRQSKPSWKQTTFGRMPGDWMPTRLERVSAFITKGSTPTTYGFGWQSDGVLFLRSECVSECGLDLSQSMFIGEDAHRLLRRSEVSSGDLLMTITGNVGRVVLLGDDCTQANINQHIARIRIVNEQVAPLFVFHFLSQPIVRRHYNLITTGQAYPQLSLKQVRETEIPLPSLREQQAIAAVLSDMDADIAMLDGKLTKTRQLKTGMMQELLTGRIRLI